MMEAELNIIDPGSPPETDMPHEDRYEIIRRRDRRFDGSFVYSVRTVGVYCRPSCAARLANRSNVAFHETCDDAERAGFRPCKRCRQNGPANDA